MPQNAGSHRCSSGSADTRTTAVVMGYHNIIAWVLSGYGQMVCYLTITMI